MKSLKILMGVSLLTLLTLAACTSEPDETRFAELASVTSDNPAFVADDTGGSVTFNTEGGSIVLNVDCGTDWEALNDSPEWLEANVSVNSGTLTLVTVQSTLDKEQTATVILQTSASGIRFATINITQHAYGAPTISVETDEWHVPAITSLTTEIAVEASDEWKVESISEDWVKAEKSSDTVSLTAEENTVEEERSAVVTLSCTDGVTTSAVYIKVIQDAYGTPTISIESNTWQAPAVGALTVDIAVDASDDWDVTSVSESWLSAEKTGDALRLTVEENDESEERTAEVVITTTDGINSASGTVTVTQDGRVYISVSDESLTLSGAGDYATVTIESNFDWDFSYDTSNGWYTVSCDDDGLTITSTNDNDTDDDFEDTIVITAGDGAENVMETKITVFEENVANTMILTYTISAAGTAITLPLAGTVDCTIKWGDGSTEDCSTTLPTHTYESAGDYDVSIRGTVTSLAGRSIGSSSVTPPLTAVKSWGQTGLTDISTAFYYCKSLASFPDSNNGALDNVEKADSAFYYCQALTTLPSNLLQGASKIKSFIRTFYYCKFTAVPESLFADCTAAESFKYALGYCQSLTTVPENLFASCENVTDFSYIFYYDNKLTAVPESLFAKNTKVETFAGAFYSAKKLASIPEGLFANCSSVTSFNSVFQNCTSLEEVPAGLFAKNSTAEDFSSAFNGCEDLETIYSDLFSGCSSATSFNGVFKGCESLESIPEGLFDGCPNVTDFTNAFYECEDLASIPEGLFDKCTSVTSFSGTFQGCESFTSVPEGLFDKCIKVTDFSSLFRDCSDIASIPAGLFANCPDVESFNYTFCECSSLTKLSENLFAGCSKATNFGYVFHECTSLTELPSGLFADCAEAALFNYAFYDCKSLTELPSDLFTGCTKATNFNYTFSNCSGLGGESPYSTIDGTAVHLYERSDYTSYFTTPTTTTSCFKSCTGLTDYDDIPSGWK